MSKARQVEIQENQVDAFTKFGTHITGDHRYIHEGKSFLIDLEESMAQNATYILSFKTPSVASGKYAHWRPADITSTASILRVSLYENITSTGGNAVTPTNMNRNSATTAVSVVKEGVTADVSAATPIIITTVGSEGKAGSRSGGSAGADNELVLKQNTEYVITVVEPNVAATVAVIEFHWYEENYG